LCATSYPAVAVCRVLRDVEHAKPFGPVVMVGALKQAENDCELYTRLLYCTAEVLDECSVTGPEKSPSFTGYIEWIEKQIGPMNRSQSKATS